jgi:UDP-2,3-diacylglucosamine pyrophosphatase LpxH
VRTAIVSDLHLGSAPCEDLVRDPAIRRLLLEELAGADRLVLLGDVLELRELPLARVLETVQPFFEELGEAMAGRRVVYVPGNHDHRVAEPLLTELALAGGELGLEHRGLPDGEAATRIGEWLGEAELSIAYPGVWLREDVYATHGHYMDCHWTIPRIECIAAAAIMRSGGWPADPASPVEYERVLRPIYGFSFGLADAGLARGATRPSERLWQSISAGRRDGGRVRRLALKGALATAIPAGLWLLNRALRAEFKADLSAAEISQGGVAAATEMVRRLRIDAAHVLTGHTHRAGPEETDSAWLLADGSRLHNTGSWVYADAFHHPGRPPGPYWPGTVTWVEDEGPPRRVRLLHEHPRDDLRAAVARTLNYPPTGPKVDI